MHHHHGHGPKDNSPKSFADAVLTVILASMLFGGIAYIVRLDKISNRELQAGRSTAERHEHSVQAEGK